MPLVRSLARRYAGRGEPVDDLVQVGAIGLIKAIDRFELERGRRALHLCGADDRRRDPASLPRPLVERPRAAADEGAVAARLAPRRRPLLRARPRADRRRARRGGRCRGGRRDRGPRDGARAHAGVALDTRRRERRADADRPDRRGRGGLRGARAGLGRPHRARGARGAGAADHRPPLPQGHDPVRDRRRARDLADARLAAPAPGARRDARPLDDGDGVPL